MKWNTVTVLNEKFNDDFIHHQSENLGVNKQVLLKTMGALLPTLFLRIIHRINDPIVLRSFTETTQSSTQHLEHNVLLSSLFSKDESSFYQDLSSYSEISESSAAKLTSIVAFSLKEVIGSFTAMHDLSSEEIKNLLKNQKEEIERMIPVGFTSLHLNSIAASTLSKTEEPFQTAITREGGYQKVSPENRTPQTEGSLLKWILPFVVLLLASWFIWNQCKQKETQTIVYTDSIQTNSEDSVNILSTKEPRQLTLIEWNGVRLKGYPNGMEEELIRNLESGLYKKAKSDKELETVWMNFDRIQFKTGSDQELEKGKDQLENIALILQNYPEVKIKIGGYTDKLGDEASNVVLSQRRATFIKDELTKLGIGNQITGAEGYGSRYAVVPAGASDQERAVDRKMAIRFTK